MTEFDKIFLTWRKGVGTRRHIVGVLQKTTDGKHIFNYEQPTVAKLQTDEGFTPYTEFQDVTKQKQIVPIFKHFSNSGKLMKPKHKTSSTYWVKHKV
jgi:hypothetical protein